MIVTTASVDEFIECLRGVYALQDGAIRVSIVRQPLDGTKNDACKFKVVFQASAVVVRENQSEYLLQVGVNCGTDYEDASQERTGSQVAREMRQAVQSVAGSRGFVLLPGVIGGI